MSSDVTCTLHTGYAGAGANTQRPQRLRSARNAGTQQLSGQPTLAIADLKSGAKRGLAKLRTTQDSIICYSSADT